MTALYVFLDDSGNTDFGPKGTQTVVLSALYTTQPTSTAAAMQGLKYELLAAGSSDIEFHATQNRQVTRDRVTEVIRSLQPIMRVHTVYLDKGRAAPSLQNDVAVLSLLGRAMGKWILKARSSGHDQVILVFDSMLTGRKQEAFKAAVKPELKQLGVPFQVLFHPVKSDLNGQIADYFSWAWFRAIEGGDSRALIQLQWSGWTQFDLFRRGHTNYWHPTKG